MKFKSVELHNKNNTPFALFCAKGVNFYMLFVGRIDYSPLIIFQIQLARIISRTIMMIFLGQGLRRKFNNVLLFV